MPQSSPNSCQFFVVGGGLAGLSFAIQAARSGYTVALAEKKTYPHNKVCGEYISLESVPFLKWLLPDFNFSTLPIITRTRLTSANGAEASRKLPLGGIGISRYLLDDLLYKEALSSGAEIHTSTKVKNVEGSIGNFKIHTDKGLFKAQFMIGAQGKRSALDGALGRSFVQAQKSHPDLNFVGIKYHVKADLPNDIIELHNFPGGYCGISKIEGDKYCMCYLVNSAWLKQYRGDIPTFQREVMVKNKALARYLAEYEPLIESPVTISNVWFGNKPLIEQDVFMIGDAAGMIAPLSGNGMSMALHASYMLFSLVNKHLRGLITLAELRQQYVEQWNNYFKSRVARGRLLQQILLHPAMSNAAISILSTFPVLLDYVIKSTHGQAFFTNSPSDAVF
jgi:flavin-dependent dehydrogenase